MKKSLLTLAAGLLSVFILMLTAQTSRAGSATWKSSPASGDWNTATNWRPQTIPNGPSDTATFATSSTTSVSLSANTEVNGIVFNAGASAFTITAVPTLTLTVSGAGITNNSGVTQNFVTATDINGTQHGTIQFTNGATAGNGTGITDSGPEASDNPGGITQFFDSSSAGNAGIANTIGSGGGFGGGGTEFYDNSSAGNGTFTCEAGQEGGEGSDVFFGEASTAENATLIANGGLDGDGGGSIDFSDDSSGGQARVKVFGNGFLDISGHNAPGVATGSIQGSG